jgi:hypothetical protein
VFESGKEVLGRLVVASCNATVLLDFVEEALDEVSRLVKVFREADRVFAVGLGRDVCLGPRAVAMSRRALASYPLICEEHGPLGQIRDHLRRAFDVASLPRRQFELQRPAFLVDERVDFCREPASGATQTSISIPLFAVAHC